MNRGRTWITLVIGLLALGMAGRMHGDLIDLRVEHKLIPEVNVLDDADPWVRFVQVGLGAFRGILVDILWTRATRLQDEGKYFELVQLSQWITKLEPRIPEVWAYHAWNMAYNISVLFNTPEERWRWVSNGIELLRNEGLHHNPDNAQLQWELGWFYQHKIGMNLDDMHFFYKKYLAEEMSLLVPGFLNYEDYAGVPKTRADLLKLPGIDTLLDRMKELGLVDGLDERNLTIEQFSRPELLQALSSDLGQQVYRYLVVKRLKNKYGLDLEVMQVVDEKFGPFDWRLHQAQSVYWAYRGSRTADKPQDVKLQRMIFQSMASAFRSGSLEIIDPDQPPRFSPNLMMLEKTLAAYEYALETHKGVSIENGHMNFLRDAVLITAQYAQTRVSKQMFDLAQTHYPAMVNGRPYETFVLDEMIGEDVDVLSDADAVARIEGFLYQSYVYIGAGSPGRAKGFAVIARKFYERYKATRAGTRTDIGSWAELQVHPRKMAGQLFSYPEAKERLDHGKLPSELLSDAEEEQAP
ncbi:MAG: hypothetical protein ACI9TH_002167 [Kiritimatiellia bacterium]|jgi:hypothetical protein